MTVTVVSSLEVQNLFFRAGEKRIRLVENQTVNP